MRRSYFSLLFCEVILLAGLSAAQDVNRQKGIVDFVAPILPDPILQHSKETYILYGCAYCHGVDLIVRNGEAADLMNSPLVGRDENGNLLAPLLRTGIPQTPKLSPMPQFSDLSDQEIADIVRWVHYARQEGRYKEMLQTTNPPGHVAAGKTYFEQKCSSCHSKETDLAHVTTKYAPSALRAQLLRPDSLIVSPSWRTDRLHDSKLTSARQQHLKLLENYSTQDLADLVAYLEGNGK